MEDNVLVPNNASTNIIELQQDDITCIGDFYLGSYSNFVLPLHASKKSELGVDVMGRCLYKIPIQLQEANVVTSFSSMFDILVYLGNISNCIVSVNGPIQVLTFIIASDTSKEGDGNGYVGQLNSNTGAQDQNLTSHNFVVEINLDQDLQFEDPSKSTWEQTPTLPHYHQGKITCYQATRTLLSRQTMMTTLKSSTYLQVSMAIGPKHPCFQSKLIWGSYFSKRTCSWDFWDRSWM